MAELEDRLNAVLSDPAQMEKIAQMASRLMGSIAPVLALLILVPTSPALMVDMPETLLFWRLCVEEAFSELLLEKEYDQAADVLRLLLDERPPRCPSLRLCLHGDGLCSLSDGEELRMEYVDESGEGILSLLVGMAPARLIVYDLSGGTRRELVRALTEIFSGRVCLYTGEFT